MQPADPPNCMCNETEEDPFTRQSVNLHGVVWVNRGVSGRPFHQPWMQRLFIIPFNNNNILPLLKIHSVR